MKLNETGIFLTFISPFSPVKFRDIHSNIDSHHFHIQKALCKSEPKNVFIFIKATFSRFYVHMIACFIGLEVPDWPTNKNELATTQKRILIHPFHSHHITAKLLTKKSKKRNFSFGIYFLFVV
jgi:hypothetical protein